MLYKKAENYTLYQGKMQEELLNLEDNSVDSVVCDPPYELNFMGKAWDNTGVAFQKETWEHCFRVLKPGGYLLAFGGSRTFHRIACAIEDAGFEIRDTIMWLYGSGFPKSLNIGLAIDKKNGVASKVVGTGKSGSAETHSRCMKSITDNGNEVFGGEYEIKEAQNEWNGWGSCLKPAYEPIIVARKPFNGSLVDNVLKYRVGGLNIGECRVDYNGEVPNIGGRGQHTRGEGYGFKALGDEIEANTDGRFPANVITDGSEEVAQFMPNTKSVETKTDDNRQNKGNSMFIDGKHNSNNSYTDSGSAARYFYCAKASKKDRDEGLTAFEEKYVYGGDVNYGYGNNNGDNFGERVANVKRRNIHTTVKPCELMQYLVRLVSPKGATILDCFMGSGSTGKAVMFENRERNANYKFIGVEMTEEYLPICEARIDYAINKYEYDQIEADKKCEEENGYVQLRMDL